MRRHRFAGSLAGTVPPAARIAVAALAAVALISPLDTAAHTWLGLGRSSHAGFIDDLLPVLSVLASAILCLGRSVLVPDDRAAWRLIGVGMFGWGLAGGYYMLVLKGAADPPFHSPADALYLAFFPAAYVAIVLLIRPRVERFLPSQWLDGLVATLGATSVAAALLYEPVLSASLAGEPAEVITNLAYPLGDLLLIFFVVGVFTMYSGRPGREWWLLLAGLLVLAATDTAFLLAVANGTYVEGGVVEAGWPTAMALIAAAAWQQPSKVRVRLGAGKALLVPLAFALGALALLVYGNLSGISSFALVLATLTLVAAGARALLTFREVQGLANSRREARTDDLTGLPNRRQLIEHLDATLARAGDGDST